MPALVNLTPVAQLRAGRFGRRFAQLLIGQLLFGASMAMMLRAGFGALPWDVLHMGLARHLPITFGQAVVGVALVLLIAWWPLKQWPGLGTVLNAVAIGPAADLALLVIPDALPPVARAALLGGGIVLNAIATGLYIGAQFGPGPRDGLFTGLARATGGSIRLVRTGIEVTVVAAGFALGGPLGVGTLLYAVAIGPLIQVFLPRLTVALPGHSARSTGQIKPPPPQ